MRDGIDLQAEGLQRWLLRGKAYVVLSVEQYSSDEIGLRISSEDGGQPVVFRASLFDVIESKLPPCWKVLAVRGNVVELGPVSFGQAEFWERFLERHPVALDEYRLAKDQVMAESQLAAKGGAAFPGCKGGGNFKFCSEGWRIQVGSQHGLCERHTRRVGFQESKSSRRRLFWMKTETRTRAVLDRSGIHHCPEVTYAKINVCIRSD